MKEWWQTWQPMFGDRTAIRHNVPSGGEVEEVVRAEFLGGKCLRKESRRAYALPTRLSFEVPAVPRRGQINVDGHRSTNALPLGLENPLRGRIPSYDYT
jgi:hypothetical protein